MSGYSSFFCQVHFQRIMKSFLGFLTVFKNANVK